MRLSAAAGGAADVPPGTRVILSLVSPGFGEAGDRVETQPSGDGVFTATAAFSGLTAQWRAEVQVRRPGHDDLLVRFDVPMAVPARTGAGTAAPGTAAGAAPARAFGYPLTAGNWGALAGALLLAAGPPLWLDARRRRARLASPRALGAAAVPLAGAATLALALWSPGAGGVPAPPPFRTAIAMRFEAPGDRFVLLAADPFQVGVNAFRATLLDGNAQPATAGRVDLRFSRLDGAVEPATEPATRAHRGDGYVATHLLGTTGWWDIDVLIDGAPGASFYVRLDAPSSAPAAWAPPGSDAPSDPQAEALFRRALARYGGVRSMRWADEITSGQLAPHGVSGWVRDDGLGVAPDDVHITTSEAIGGPAINEVVRKGPAWCTWSQGGDWNCRLGAALPPFNPDDFAGSTAFASGRAETVDGHPTHVVSFYSAPQQYWYAWWVDDATGDVRREALLGPYHIMITRYFDQDAPATVTLPPAAASITPTPAAAEPSAAPVPSAAAAASPPATP